ncbi:MAG: formylglycine-generating enzyme family protein [Planctomycetota bacterium]
MRKRRLVISLVVLLLLVGITVIVWKVADWPPPRLILKYGFPPTGGPTGRTRVIEGIEFVELSPGYVSMRVIGPAARPPLRERLKAWLGLGPAPSSPAPWPRWFEFPRRFWIARTEITNLCYETVDPHHERMEDSMEDNSPVVGVSWEEARRFCETIAERSGLPIRLPNSSEWEYACRAGSTTKFSFGNSVRDLPRYAWCETNSEGRAHAVATRDANPWGLFDMHGNVAEWCEGGKSYGEDAIEAELRGEEVACGYARRTFRGGDWLWPDQLCMSDWRSSRDRRYAVNHIGFRPAFSNPDD